MNECQFDNLGLEVTLKDGKKKKVLDGVSGGYRYSMSQHGTPWRIYEEGDD
jgi:hypothetical protein